MHISMCVYYRILNSNYRGIAVRVMRVHKAAMKHTYTKNVGDVVEKQFRGRRDAY